MHWICCCQTIPHMPKVCRPMDPKSFCNMGIWDIQPHPHPHPEINANLKAREIAFVNNTHFVCPIILHRARQYHCRAQCKVSKRLVKWGNSCRNPNFEAFDFRMSFGKLSCIAQPLIPDSKGWNFLCRICKRSFKSAFIRRHTSHIKLFIWLSHSWYSGKLQFHRLFHIGELTQN